MGFTFIFLDGTGIGERSEFNPFFISEPRVLRFWNGATTEIKDMEMKPIDPLLGIEGIPQSATGQTTIYTGINVPKVLGKHTGSFPNRRMRKIIKENNILKKIDDTGFKPYFINAYPLHSKIFSAPNIKITESGTLIFSDDFPQKFKKRISVTTSMIVSNGTTPYDVEDILRKRSLYQDFSNLSLIRLGLNIPEISPEKAGEILSLVTEKNDFSLYEYFQTDFFGHRKSSREKIDLIKRLDRMFISLFQRSDPARDTILITSDHGNLEESRNRLHTKNMVPLIIWGKGRSELSERINSLCDITPGIIETFN